MPTPGRVVKNSSNARGGRGRHAAPVVLDRDLHGLAVGLEVSTRPPHRRPARRSATGSRTRAQARRLPSTGRRGREALRAHACVQADGFAARAASSRTEARSTGSGARAGRLRVGDEVAPEPLDPLAALADRAELLQVGGSWPAAWSFSSSTSEYMFTAVSGLLSVDDARHEPADPGEPLGVLRGGLQGALSVRSWPIAMTLTSPAAPKMGRCSPRCAPRARRGRAGGSRTRSPSRPRRARAPPRPRRNPPAARGRRAPRRAPPRAAPVSRASAAFHTITSPARLATQMSAFACSMRSSR